MLEYVYCWIAQTAHDMSPELREKMVRELNSMLGAVQECPAWDAIVTPTPPDGQGQLASIIFRATTMFEALLQPAFSEDGRFVETWVRPSVVLRDVIRQTYEGERPEMEALVKNFPGDDCFYRDHFWPLYLDSLLLRETDVREFCHRHQIPQVREMKGYMREANLAQVSAPSPLPKAELTQGHLGPGTSQSVPKKKNRGHGAISGAAAATALGVTERTIRTWEADPQKMPKGYPGRNDAAAFHLFVNAYWQNKRLEEQARAMNRAVSGGVNADHYGDYERDET